MILTVGKEYDILNLTQEVNNLVLSNNKPLKQYKLYKFVAIQNTVKCIHNFH